MPATVLSMSMSLDGFIAGPNEGPDNGLGDGGQRLHHWILPGGGGVDERSRPPSGGVNGLIVDEFMSTGAVVAGRGTFEPAGGWGGDHHDGVPIFILTRRDPGRDRGSGRWSPTSTTSRTAMARAKEAAGDKNVLVHGAGTTQLALSAGVLDEMELHRHPRAVRPGATALRGPRARADRARAHPDPRGRRRCHPHALPRPALTSAFPRLATSRV